MFHDVASEEEVTPDKPATAYINGFDVMVRRVVSGELYVTDRWCPHARGDLTHGTLEGCELTCPDHGWTFNLSDGTCHQKKGENVLATYPFRVRDGRIEVDLPERSAPTS